ncbi:MAG: oligosaccharide flippase family protein [Woeseia sp.]|nr:oligosaccharide flippase family protein [Woeseia sp.]
MKQDGVKSILKNTVYLSSARAATSLARLVYVALLAKILGAELYGLLAYAMSWYLIFIPVSVFGIDTLLIRGVGRDRNRAPLLIGQTLVLRSITSLVVGVLCLLIGLWAEPEPSSRTLLFVFSVALVGRSLALWSNAVFIAHESSGFVLGQEVVFRLLEVLVGISALLAGFGVIEIALIHAASWLLQGTAGQILIRRHLLSVSPHWEAPALFGLLKDGLPFVLSAFLIAWLMQGPIVLYAQVLGVGAELGQLALAIQALFIIGVIASEISGPAIPVLSRSVDREDGKTSQFVDLMLRSGIVMGGLLAVSGLTAGDWLIDLLFGDAYQETASILPWTLMLVTPFFWSSTLSAVITAHGRYWLLTLCRAIGALVFTIAIPLIGTSFGLLGVILALGAGLIALSVCQLLVLRQYYVIDLFLLFGRTLVVIFGAFFVSKTLVPHNIWLALIAGIIILVSFGFVTGVLQKKELKTGSRFLLSVIKGR